MKAASFIDMYSNTANKNTAFECRSSDSSDCKAASIKSEIKFKDE